MNPINGQEQIRLTNPQQEEQFLRQQVAQQQETLAQQSPERPVTRQEAAQNVVEQYRQPAAEKFVSPELASEQNSVAMLVMDLPPKNTDQMVQELFRIAMEKGIRNALVALDKVQNPALVDDFHRFLAAYLASTRSLPKTEPKSELFRKLDMRLFEVALPEAGQDDQRRVARELVAMMEQFYLGMMSVARQEINRTKDYFTLEIALSNDSDHLVFYVAVPSQKAELFEKQILAVYQGAIIVDAPNDYNIFNPGGMSAGAYARPSVNQMLTIKTFETMDHDPLDVILNVFSKLETRGEGAAIQIVVRPAGQKYNQQYTKAIRSLREGKDIKAAEKAVSSTWSQVFDFVASAVGGEKKNQGSEKVVDDNAVSSVSEKVKSPIVETNIRVIASANNQLRAEQIVNDMQSAFNQFTNTAGNGVAFRLLQKRALKQFFKDYVFRSFDEKYRFNLSLKELSTLFHFPSGIKSSPQLKQATAKTAPAPLDVPSEGLFMGRNIHRNQVKDVYMTPKDRVRHFYVIGQTGTGKTYFLRSLIKQDIENGDGCCFIDPHGSDVQEILSYVPADRVDDVIYFDPAYTPRPMGLNMLEFDRRFPEQKTFVVDEMLGIFQKLFGSNPEAMGPAFQQYFRNAVMLVIEDPESGTTLLEVARVLADEEFRKLKLSRCGNPIVKQFWEEIAGKAGGDASLANIVPYITNKFDIFLSNEIMRPIIGQEQSAFNMRDVMDNRKILLVNLSKGRLGEINANLIGLILVGKILMAALSRVDNPDYKSLPPFYLYIDEFQNVTTNSISQILSEARKYGLGLNVAHQFIAQLEESIKNAVFGNVGSIGVFRISPDDAQYLEKRLQPTFDAQDIMKLTMGNYYLQMLGNGTPLKPFNVNIMDAIQGGNPNIIDKLQQLSFLKYGRDRAQVEAEVMAKYNAAKGK
jgi:hypothetical protein